MTRRRTATNPATSMLFNLSTTVSGWLGLRPSNGAPRPMLIRLPRVVAALRTVRVNARWRVGAGQELTTSQKLYVSDGVCLLPWARDARSVTIDMEFTCPPLAVESLVVNRSAYQGEVLELE